MKEAFFLILSLSSNLLFGQTPKTNYRSIDSVGWKMMNFSVPSNLTEQDAGEVKYLLTLNRKGYVKTVELLENTFSESTERKWRAEVKKLVFSRVKSGEKAVYKGTLSLARQRCSETEADTLDDSIYN
jgi:hypothetical protein